MFLLSLFFLIFVLISTFICIFICIYLGVARQLSQLKHQIVSNPYKYTVCYPNNVFSYHKDVDSAVSVNQIYILFTVYIH